MAEAAVAAAVAGTADSASVAALPAVRPRGTAVALTVRPTRTAGLAAEAVVTPAPTPITAMPAASTDRTVASVFIPIDWLLRTLLFLRASGSQLRGTTAEESSNTYINVRR
jgi:hypothetical protein